MYLDTLEYFGVVNVIKVSPLELPTYCPVTYSAIKESQTDMGYEETAPPAHPFPRNQKPILVVLDCPSVETSLPRRWEINTDHLGKLVALVFYATSLGSLKY